MDREEARKKIYQKFIKNFLRYGVPINDNIGRLLNYLEESDELDNTIVIYTSDQGSSLQAGFKL